jgi:hypothetical protein
MKRTLGAALLLIILTHGCSTPDEAGPSSDPAAGGSAGASASGAGMAGMVASAGSGETPVAGSAGSGGSSSGGSGGSGGAPSVSGSGGMGGMVIPVGETPPAEWVNITGTLAGMASECGNLGRVASHPYRDQLIVGVALKGLFGSADGGATWQPLGASGTSITNRISWLAYDPTSADIFWESGIYNAGGVYKTIDGGATFTQVGDVTHCDSVSVDFSDPARKTLLAGSHEQARKLFRSTDGGATWQDIGMKLPAASGFCTTSLILDSKTLLVGCGGWYGGDPGIYRSTDGGESFQPVSNVGVAGQPLLASDGTIYWGGHQAGGLYKSADQGLTFMPVRAANEARSVEPIELPDGRIVTVGPTTLIASSDQGQTWEPLLDPLPFTPFGVSYSPFRNAFYVWQWDCGMAVMNDAIARYGYDYRE